MNEKILIVDDDAHIRNACAESLRIEGYAGVQTAESGDAALEIIKKVFFNVVLTDLKMPGLSGTELLSNIKKISPKTEVIIFTAYGTVETAVAALKSGAYDYITKPIDLNELDLVIARALEKQRLAMEVGEYKELVNLYEISRAMGSVMKLPDILEFIVKLAGDTLSADGGSIMLLDKHTNDLIVKASTGARGNLVLDKRIGFGERVAGYSAKENQPILVDGDVEHDPRFSNLEGYDGIKSGLCVPLVRKNKVIGVINLNRLKPENKFTNRDLNLLSIFASQAAIAIENSQILNELEEEKEKIDVIFRDMRDGAVITDAQFKIIMLNRTAESILDIKKEDCSLKKFPESLSDFEPSVSIEKIYKDAVSFDLVRVKGKSLFLSVSVTKILDEEKNITGYIFVFRDVTSERKEEKIKRNFLSFISHKLRTPLAGITGYIALLRKQSFLEKLHNTEKKAFETIENQSELLAGLVDKLLRFTSLESEFPECKKQKLSLVTVVKTGIEVLDERMKSEAKINIDIPECEVFVDKEMMVQVIQNLVENAVKFNNKKEKAVNIKASLEFRELSLENKHSPSLNSKLSTLNSVQVTVEDNGPGIPPEEIPKLFQKFYQIEEYFTGQVEGVGVGLAFIKKIIELHGGRVWMESELGKGSKFYFTIPINRGRF